MSAVDRLLPAAVLALERPLSPFTHYTTAHVHQRKDGDMWDFLVIAGFIQPFEQMAFGKGLDVIDESLVFEVYEPSGGAYRWGLAPSVAE
jgi:hypothetical protein